MYREETRRARKPRRCDACNTRIEAGETYLHIVGHNADGDFGSAAYHPDCRAWEVEQNKHAGLGSDEWYSLDELVADDRRALDGAPAAVVARFPEPTA